MQIAALVKVPYTTQLHTPPPSSIHLHPAPSTSTQLHPAPPSSTQLHPAPSTSTQLILTSTQLFPPPFTSTQLISVCTSSLQQINNILTKILHVIGQFPQILVEKLKVVHFDWKLAHMVYWRSWFRIQT